MDCVPHRKNALDLAVEILGSKWNLLIIWYLRDGALRFTELKRRMGDVNPGTVATHLKELESQRIICRTAYLEMPPRVEYELTAQGKALLPIFQAICDWSEVYAVE